MNGNYIGSVNYQVPWLLWKWQNGLVFNDRAFPPFLDRTTAGGVIRITKFNPSSFFTLIQNRGLRNKDNIGPSTPDICENNEIITKSCSGKKEAGEVKYFMLFEFFFSFCLTMIDFRNFHKVYYEVNCFTFHSATEIRLRVFSVVEFEMIGCKV